MNGFFNSVLLAILVLFLWAPGLRADAFDRYVNTILAKALGAEGVKELKQLTPKLITDNNRVLPETTGALLIVQTNEGRFAKLLVHAARRKIDADSSIPILLIERYVTYKVGEERAVYDSGKDIILFDGFHFSLDMGQVVPPKLGGDLRFVTEGGKTRIEPLGKAKLYLVTKPLPGTELKKTAHLVVGEKFEIRYFNGTYKLYDDGRRSGTLKLSVGQDGEVTGAYYSDKDGQKYEVVGKVSSPKHAFQFTIKLPRTEQTFQGWLFTGNAKALTGSSRLGERETGFYAVRVEEE